MDFLVPHPNGKWLVTNPSTSPENFTGSPGNSPYFDETTGSMLPGTTICDGSSIDMEIITDLFTNYAKAAAILGKDTGYAAKVQSTKARLRPPLVGAGGALQEWTEDWPQLEKQHRHSSPLYGLYPGHVFSVRYTPELIDPIKAVLNQRGDNSSMGWSKVWKITFWANLRAGNRADSILNSYLSEAWPQLFTRGGATVMQVDGTLGVTAAISEMLVQSNNGYIDLLPALPAGWSEGEFNGVCTVGAFVLDIKWQHNRVISAKVLSRKGGLCRIFTGARMVEFPTVAGGVYKISP